MLHSVYDEPDTPGVLAQFERHLEYIEAKLPAVRAHLRAAREDILAHPFPTHVWTQI
jgi:transposase-like protein